jgi:hypothetical protein
MTHSNPSIVMARLRADLAGELCETSPRMGVVRKAIEAGRWTRAIRRICALEFQNGLIDDRTRALGEILDYAQGVPDVRAYDAILRTADLVWQGLRHEDFEFLCEKMVPPPRKLTEAEVNLLYRKAMLCGSGFTLGELTNAGYRPSEVLIAEWRAETSTLHPKDLWCLLLSKYGPQWEALRMHDALASASRESASRSCTVTGAGL